MAVISPTAGHIRRVPFSCLLVLREPGLLPGIVNGARLAYHTDLDLAGVVKALLDLVGDLAGQAIGAVLIDLIGLDDDPHLAPSLNGKGLLDAGERVGDALQGFEALEIEIDSLAPRPRPGSRDGIGGLDDGGLQALRFHLAGVMSYHRMNNLGRLAKTTRNLATNDGMWPLDLLINGLADVMQQGGGLADVHIGSQLMGDGARENSNFDRVSQHILTVTGAEMEPPQDLEQLGLQA